MSKPGIEITQRVQQVQDDSEVSRCNVKYPRVAQISNIARHTSTSSTVFGRRSTIVNNYLRVAKTRSDKPFSRPKAARLFSTTPERRQRRLSV